MSWNQNIKRIIDVCEVTAGQSPEGKYYNKVGEGLPFYQGKKEFTTREIGEPTTWTTKTTKEAFKDDILMSVRAPVGPINIATQSICIGRGLAAIRASNKVNNDYLFYFLLKHESEIVGNVGAVFNSINKNQIGNIPIPIPPIQEQKQIVEILDKAFTAIDQAKANIEKNIINAKELFQSKLNAIFSQKGAGWEEKSLGELGKVSMCKRILKNQTTPDGDIPFYKIGTFGKKANAFIPKEIYDDFINKYSFPKKGDILISASGTIGRRVIYDGLPAYFQDSNIVWIDNNEVLVTNEYLYQFYGVCDWNPSKGATISRLYNSDLRRINISFPNIKEQKQIVPNMVKLSEQTLQIELNYKQKLEDLEELKKAILQKAFAGELTQKEVVV
jgi:type I restriction enzyme S subunit